MNQPRSTSRPQNPSTPIADLIEARFSRRSALKGLAAIVAGISAARAESDNATVSQALRTPFHEVPHGQDQDMHFPPEFRAQVLMRWGDPVLVDAPKFDPHHQTAGAQAQQFGYNNDFLAFLPLPRGSKNSTHGLLCANHEYTIAELMLPAGSEVDFKAQVDVQMAAHGHSVVEIAHDGSGWSAVPNSQYNRRLTANATKIQISGPARGSDRLKTSADPDGVEVLGTINNCSGGVTPWGTILSGEENFNTYFLFEDADGVPSEARNYKRFALSDKPEYHWHQEYARFDVAQEPHEPNRFGWIVEFDPYDPHSVPVKRTALGRMKHEGATPIVSSDGRVVVYLGDDQRHDYLYRFVTARKFDPQNRQANVNLLDDGTLYVARFEADGRLQWLPLVHGQGPLTADNGFHSQADVVIEARIAADLLGATPMDRPEDIDVHPLTGRVYVMLTNNTDRTEVNSVNPRLKNKHGQILELLPPGDASGVDHTATEFRWELLLLAGQPGKDPGAQYNPDVTQDGWLTCPDNCTFDPQGNLWISTDNGGSTTMADGLYLCGTEGPTRALTRHFFRGPTGAEITGPCFTPDGSTLFLSIQHPGDDKDSTFANPSTRWPDFDPQTPPRPSVVAVQRKTGGPIVG